MDQLLSLVDLLLGVGHDETVEIFLLVAGVGRIGTAFAFLDGAFAADSNLGSGLGLHLLQGVATGSNK